MGYLFVDTPRQQFMGNIGLGYRTSSAWSATTSAPAIWTTGEDFMLKLSSTAKKTDDFVFNEALSDAGDWRISHVAAVTAKPSSLFSLQVPNTVRYVNTTRWSGSSQPTASRQSRW